MLKTRPPGMSINLIPLYAWYILATGVMILFAFPPLIAGDILLEMERLLDWPFFDPARGGDPILWQHLFWIFGHPEVYIVFLPAVGVVAMIVPTFAQRPIVGYSWIVLAAVGTGFISFGLWVHHMYATGLPVISLSFFSAASEAVVIPTGVQIFAFIATLFAGKVKLETPMLFVMGFLFTFVIGGLSGVMVALVPFDWQVHDTYFVVAHLHYVLIGGMLFPMFAAAYYWMPVISGRVMTLGKPTFWLMFTGFHVGFFPMHFTGLLGMPRRVYTYPEGLGWDWLNLDLDRRRLRLRGRRAAVRARRRAALLARREGRPQPLERRHARLDDGDPARGLGRAQRADRRDPLPALAAGELPRRRRQRALPDPGRARYAARDHHHQRGRRPARAGAARARQFLVAVPGRDRDRRLLHRRDLPRLGDHGGLRRSWPSS